MKVLVTCPPMLRNLDEFRPRFEERAIDVAAPTVVQTLTEPELIELLPGCDGWIIGDDPATRAVFAAGKAGRLKAAVKWGVGVDNVDLEAAGELGIPIANTPCMFGKEVADLAMGYVTALAREFVAIDRGVRGGGWPKPTGISLEGRTVALVGYGDIGRNTARRLLAAEMRVLAYDPVLESQYPTASDRSGSVARSGGGGGLHRADVRPDTRDAPHAGLRRRSRGYAEVYGLSTWRGERSSTNPLW